MTAHGPARTPMSTTPVFRRILALGAVLVAVVAVVGSIVGGVLVGAPGVAGALVGAALALLLVSTSSVSILFANRYAGSPSFPTVFFGAILGGWLAKFVIFIVALVLLRDAAWVDRYVLFAAVSVAVVGALVIDVVVIQKARVPAISDPAAGR